MMMGTFKTTIFMLLGIACLTACGPKEKAKTLKDGDYPIQPVVFTSVKLTDHFWAPRIKTNHEVTIPFTMGKLQETGRIKNFQIAAGLDTGKFCTQFTFDDTDVYKIIEGACYSFQIFSDPKLEAKVDSLITLIGEAQEEDGYIYTNRTIMGEHGHEWAGTKRWEKVEDLSHELYNIGHLIEAAVAHYQATGKRNFLDIAIKAADRVCADFGPGKLELYPGHQIIELAMAKLYHVTGDKKYLDMGKFFLDVRGPGGDAYNQAHKKVVNQHTAVGHAVRATYMYAGMADIAAMTQDTGYVHAIDDIWEDVVSKKLYVTGGIGATGNGEAFGDAYDLPNMSAYCETCASIANVYWNYRLFLMHGDAKYYDVLERTLYNAFLSGVSLEGDAFFYPNPLESQGQHARSHWFSCACCPGNVTRFVPSVSKYFYAKKEGVIYVNLFGENEATIDLEGNEVQLHQVTDYPWKGDITIEVSPESSAQFDVMVRIPEWAQGQPLPSDLYTFMQKTNASPTASVNGEAVDMTLEKGFLVLSRTWEKGDKIEVHLPMEVREIKAHDSVQADVQKMAIERGPLVYCAEWPDNGGKVLNITVDPNQSFTTTYDPDMLKGVYLIKGKGQSVSRAHGDEVKLEEQDVTLIPYYAWAHRGAGEMMVWLPTSPLASRPLPAPTIASKSEIKASHPTKGLIALNDQMLPSESGDRSILYYHWWPKKDTTEWVEYDFEKAATVSSAQVYWYDDGPFGGCRIPQSWTLKYKKGDQWIAVDATSDYEVKKDAFCKVSFKPVQTTALRMEVQLPEDNSAGIMEWKVE